jgi:hypothetical protein
MTSPPVAEEGLQDGARVDANVLQPLGRAFYIWIWICHGDFNVHKGHQLHVEPNLRFG